jgi:hypothetical protein
MSSWGHESQTFHLLDLIPTNIQQESNAVPIYAFSYILLIFSPNEVQNIIGKPLSPSIYNETVTFFTSEIAYFSMFSFSAI